MSDALGGDAWSSGSYLDCCGGLRVSFRDYRYLCLLSPPPPPLSPPPPPPRDGVRSFYIYRAQVTFSEARPRHFLDMSQLGPFCAHRAQSDVDYPIGNHNLANLPGVLKYVHSEVVNAQSYDSGVCTRHYEISRILRYRLSSSSPSARRRLRLGITMLTRYPRLDFLNPPPFGAGFGPFVAFDRGRCTIYECATQADFWTSRGGFYVGCQEAQQLGYQGAAWYSLAGSCPGEAWERKGAACKRLQRGGECAHSRRTEGETPQPCPFRPLYRTSSTGDQTAARHAPGGSTRWARSGSTSSLASPTAATGATRTIATRATQRLATSTTASAGRRAGSASGTSPATPRPTRRG